MFDLKNLMPGVKLRRLQGSEGQDRQVNDGSRVGEQITLGPCDALFLVKE